MKSLSSFSGSGSTTLNGPVALTPAVTHVLICLHGFGSSGDDLIALAAPLQLTLGNLGESLAVYAPHAPSLAPGEHGYQWFRDMGWTFRDEPGLKTAANLLDDLIANIMAVHNLPTSHIAVLGFSQGAMTLLHALPNIIHQPAAAIACAGKLTVIPNFPPNTPRPPILFIHGQDDDVLPADASIEAADIFQKHSYPTQVEILPGLGHGIDARTLAHIAVFLGGLWNPETEADTDFA